MSGVGVRVSVIVVCACLNLRICVGLDVWVFVPVFFIRVSACMCVYVRVCRPKHQQTPMHPPTHLHTNTHTRTDAHTHTHLHTGTPLVDPLADGALLFEALRDGVRTRNPFASVGRLKDLSPTQATSLIGLDPRFVEAELSLMEALRTGKSVEQHLEPSYYAAMERAMGAMNTEPKTPGS